MGNNSGGTMAQRPAGTDGEETGQRAKGKGMHTNTKPLKYFAIMECTSFSSNSELRIGRKSKAQPVL